MTELVHAVLLALVQGLTEFLPISSSAHLVLLPWVAGWSDQGLAFDVAVHAGTLAAVLAYFRDEIASVARQWWLSVTGRPATRDARLGWAVLLGTLPVGLGGWLFGEHIETVLREPVPIALATIVFGLLLGWADRRGARQRDEHTLSWRDVLVVGVAQALALVPGVSRSGVTITAALALGLTRQGAARFSFLLAIPVIALAGAWKAHALLAPGAVIAWPGALAGAAVAAASAYLCIHFFLRLVERIGMLPFVAYRLLLGGVLLFLAL